MYIEQKFGMQVKPNIKEMIKAIRTEAVNTFREAEWMNENTQADLLQKLDDLEFKYVGFLNDLMDSVKMKKKYENLILGSNFFQSSYKLTQNLKQNIDKENFLQDPYYTPPYEVNAFYNDIHNSISKNFLYYLF